MMRSNAETVLDARYALMTSDFRTLDRFMAEGMDLNIVGNNNKSLLWYACHDDLYEGAKWLLTHGIRLETTTNSHGETALMKATAGNDEIVQLLLDAGANIHTKDKLSRNASVYALLNTNESSFHLLMNAGSDINALFISERKDYLSFLEQPFVLKYIAEHHEKLAPENVRIWNHLRLKSVFQ